MQRVNHPDIVIPWATGISGEWGSHDTDRQSVHSGLGIVTCGEWSAVSLL